MIVVVATLKVVEGKGDEFEQEFRKLALKVRDEPGTIVYVLHRAIDDPTKFFVYEKYKDQEALGQHSSTAHFQEFFKAITPILSGGPEIGLYHEIS